MKKVTLAVLMASLLVFAASDAFATPTVDGVNSVGEWVAGLILDVGDFDEGTIPNDYDISRIAMFMETSGGGAGDGLYVLIDLYGDPTFASLGLTDVIYTTGLDISGDGDFNDAVDRKLEFKGSGFTVYNGLGAVVAGAPVADLEGAGEPDVVEYFIPSAMFAGFPLGGFNTLTELNNGGTPPDDQVPDSGLTTTIPEPTSMILFGSGLLGALGAVRRKRLAS